jgi:thioredoxin 2
MQASTQRVTCQDCGQANRLAASGQGIPRCGSCRHPLPWITDAADADFAEIVEGATIDVLVEVWAPWCPLCRRANPALERLARLQAGRLKLVRVDVTQAPALQQRFVIESVPALMLMRGPRILGYQAGAPPEPSLRAWLERSSRAGAAEAGTSLRLDGSAYSADVPRARSQPTDHASPGTRSPR